MTAITQGSKEVQRGFGISLEALKTLSRVVKLEVGSANVHQCRKTGSVDLQPSTQMWLMAGREHVGKDLSFDICSIPHIQQQGGKYLEDSLAGFSEVHSLFLTFPSNGELDWEWGSYQIPISIFSLWMFPV